MADRENDFVEMLDTSDGKGISLKVLYSDAQKLFKVDVSYGEKTLSREFNATYRPVFGMDVVDHAQAMEIAEDLAVQIEQEFNL